MSATEVSTRSARRWLRVRDAADHLGMGVSTLNKLRLTGGGPRFVKHSSIVLYDRLEIDRWLEERKVASTSQRPLVEPTRWLAGRKVRSTARQSADAPDPCTGKRSTSPRPAAKPIRWVDPAPTTAD